MHAQRRIASGSSPGAWTLNSSRQRAIDSLSCSRVPWAAIASRMRPSVSSDAAPAFARASRSAQSGDGRQDCMVSAAPAAGITAASSSTAAARWLAVENMRAVWVTPTLPARSAEDLSAA
jgi:hypothetical protein